MKKLFITLLLLSFFIGIKAQTPITICPDQTSFSGMTRGYHFTSPTNFTVCGIYVEDDRSTAAQSCEIVRFLAGPPPAYNGTTNNFVSLFRQINYAPNAMISVPNVAINNGDIIGVYGSRGNAVNSYGQANCNVTINGNPTTLQRSGMQANLGATGQMQNIWSEVNYYIGRVTLYHSCCPQPPAISNIFGPDTVCIGDTITYGVVPPANVQSYNWIVPGNATIISGQNTSQLNVVFNSSPGGQICIEYDDTCTTSPQTCLNVAVVPNVNVTVTDSTESCTGRCDGFAYATYNSGGFGPFTYTWNTAPVQVGDTAFNLCGGNYNLTVTDHGCDTDIPFVMQSSPISCCNANVGTNTITMNGNGTNNYVLCDGDTAIITSNLDTGNTFGTNPGLGYAIFECNPTYPVDMYNDPCYTGVISNEILDLRTINVNGSSGGLLASLIAGGANITNNTLYFVPITLNDTFALTFDTSCIDIGQPIAVTYLEPLNAVGVENCANNTVNVTITGGYPEIFPGNNYNISNLQPVTAGLSSTTVNVHGGTVNITGLQPGDMYSFDITDDNGCPYTFSGGPYVDVVISDTTMTNETCFGACDGSITINAIGATQYSINNGSTFQAMNVFNNLCPGVYNVIATDGSCSDTVVVTLTGPNAPISIPNVITNATCKDSCNGQITINPMGGTPLGNGGYVINWSSSGNTTITETNLCAGNVTVRVTDSLGCFIDSTFTVTEPSAVTISNISNDTTICINQNTMISASANGGNGFPYTFYWDNGLGSGQIQNVAPGVNTTYNVYATDANGCYSDTANVTVSLYPPLNVAASPSDTVCPGETTIISALGNGGNGGPYTYTWNNGLGNGSTHNVSPLTTTKYIVSFDDGCSPTVYDSVTIYVISVPNPGISVDDVNGCEGIYSPTFHITNPSPGNVYNWMFGDGATATGDTVNHTYTNSGIYDVTVTVTTPANIGGCTVSATYNSIVEVYPLPTPAFTYNPNAPTSLNPTVNFYDQSYFNIQYWNWNFGGLDSSSLENPTYVFPNDTGNYPVLLVVTDINGCTSSILNYVKIKSDQAIFAPNAFTPNANGNNDVFKPVGFGIDVKSYELLIFNRWGELIYKTNDIDKGWDGTYNGKLVKNDTYIWKVTYRDFEGDSHEKIGHITLIY